MNTTTLDRLSPAARAAIIAARAATAALNATPAPADDAPFFLGGGSHRDDRRAERDAD